MHCFMYKNDRQHFVNKRDITFYIIDVAPYKSKSVASED